MNDNEEQQFMAAFDKATGEEMWRTELGTVEPGFIVSYDLSGAEIWRMSGVGMMAIPMPFAYQGMLYVDAGKGRPVFAIRPGASGDITPAALAS